MNQPNILLMLVDDMGYKDLGVTGSSFYETPHIDRLAAQGMLFSQCYASCPVCSPTRASLLTGKYPARVGVTNWIDWTRPDFPAGRLADAPYVDHLPEEEFTLAQALAAGGYQTWHVGKWHLGDGDAITSAHGFDVNVGGSHWGSPIEGYFSPWNIPGVPNGPEGQYLDDWLTDEAIRLMEQRDAGRPFFLNLWFYLVHIPLQAPEALVEKYRRKARRMGLDRIDPMAEGERFSVEHLRDRHIQRRMLQSNPVYAAMVEKLDENVGRILEALDRLGLWEDTLVLFTSDNGGLSTAEGSPTCNFPLREGKGWLEEGGLREPCVIRWPGRVQPGSLCRDYFTTPDFYPTLLEAAELPLRPEQHVDGVSIMPLLSGEHLDRGPIFWHYPHYSNQGGTPGCAMRMGDYKLIEQFESRGTYQLYNLRDDPSETVNLAEREPGRVEELAALLSRWRDTEVQGYVNPINPNWNPWD